MQLSPQTSSTHHFAYKGCAKKKVSHSRRCANLLDSAIFLDSGHIYSGSANRSTLVGIC